MTDDPFMDPARNGYAGERTDVRRTKDGRPYIWSFEKEKETPYTRVTSFIDVLDDKTMLARWGERMALLGIRDSVELGRELMALLPCDPEDEAALDAEKKALNDLVSRAKEFAGSRKAAQYGTDLHGLTEMADRAEVLPDLDAKVQADLDAYLVALERHRIVPVEIEVFVANDELKAAGTFDRTMDWYRDGWDEPPMRVIGDLKTGRVDYGQGKLAMQLALYANSKRYDPEKPQERESLGVSTTTGLVIHLPAGKAECKVYETDLTLGWEGLQLAKQVREWRRRTARGVLGDLDLQVT